MAATLLRLCRKGTNRESLIMLMLLSAVDGASIVGVFSSPTQSVVEARKVSSVCGWSRYVKSSGHPTVSLSVASPDETLSSSSEEEDEPGPSGPS